MFDRRIDGEALTFGVTGFLRLSNLVMWDQETESWWQQGTMQAIVGEHAGEALPIVASHVISYGITPYQYYDTSAPFLFEGRPDTRLPVMERVVGLTLGGAPIAYPFEALRREPVLYQKRGAQEIVLFFDEGTVSPLDQPVIRESRAVGSAAVFLPLVEGQRLTFRKKGQSFVDQETGSTWSILGKAVDGELKGKSLAPVFHTQPFWFYWSAVYPDTEVYRTP